MTLKKHVKKLAAGRKDPEVSEMQRECDSPTGTSSFLPQVSTSRHVDG